MSSSHSHVQGPVGPSPENDDLRGHDDSVDHDRPQAKRKRSSSARTDGRKKVSRACDSCKEFVF